MAASDMVDLMSRVGATYVGIESAYGSASAAPTMTRCFPTEGSKISLKRTGLKNADEREHFAKHPLNVQGLKSADATLGYYLRPAGTQLTSAGATETHPLGILMTAAWGGAIAAAGSVIDGGASTTTVINVTAGHGSRFKAGQWIGVEVAGALEFARVLSISTDAITIRPALSGAPSAAAAVVNSYTYVPTQSNTNSLYLQHVKAQDTTNHKWALKAGAVGCGLSLKRGELLAAEFGCRFANWSFTSGDSISAAAATDGMAAPVAMRGAYTLVQAIATTSRVQYPLHELSVDLPGDMGMVHLPELGGTEGTTGVMRAVDRPFGGVKLKFRADYTTITSLYANQTKLSVICIVPVGSGTTMRAVVVDVPTCFIAEPPQQMEEGGRLVYEAALEPMADETTTVTGLSGTNLDCALAPIRVALL